MEECLVATWLQGTFLLSTFELKIKGSRLVVVVDFPLGFWAK